MPDRFPLDKSRPDLLLQYLIQAQQRDNYVAPEFIAELSTTLQIPSVQINALIDFYSFLHRRPRGDFDIYFSDNITDQMAGSRTLLAQLCELLQVEPGQTRTDQRLTLSLTSCTGMSDQGPALLINGLPVTQLNPGRIEQIAALVEQRQALETWPQAFFAVHDHIQRRGLLLNTPQQPGAALRKLQQQGAERVLQELNDSGLRGRGGAGFKTAQKWRLCREAAGEAHYVICNADEGEPGTFKDRVLLQRHASDVIEGMTLCAGIIGARRGFIYLRGEYRYLLPHLEQELEKQRASGLLGAHILGQPEFNFDIEIHLGAGAYICGEESALINSLQGERGVPRKRPPFPVSCGYQNQPSVVNNVETFMAAAKIAVQGSEWFRSQGTADSPGSKLISVSGDCSQPGIYEYPLGVSVAQILSDCGGCDAQAVQVAGAAGKTLICKDFERCIAMEDVATGGSFMIFNRQRDLLDMVKNFTEFFAHESCGFCTPCRVGSHLLKDVLAKVHSGQASLYDLDELRRIGNLMQAASHCGLGMTAPNAVLDTLRDMPEIYRRRLRAAEYAPSFDLDAAVSEARDLTGRDDEQAHLAKGCL